MVELNPSYLNYIKNLANVGFNSKNNAEAQVKESGKKELTFG